MPISMWTLEPKACRPSATRLIFISRRRLTVLLERLLVGQGRLRLAARHHGLELLGAHHRAHAGAAGEAALVVHDAAYLTRFSPPGPMEITGRACPRSPSARISSVSKASLPQRCDASRISTLVGDIEVDRLVGGAGDDDAVVPGGPELGGDVAAHAGLAPDAGQRRAGADLEAASAGQVDAGERPHHDHQRVVGAERVDLPAHVVEEHLPPGRCPRGSRGSPFPGSRSLRWCPWSGPPAGPCPSCLS